MYIKKVRCILMILVGGIVLATLLQFIAYSLPTGAMRKNVEQSVQIFEEEGTYKRLVSGDDSTMLDNYTDSVMLLHAIYNGKESLIDRSMNVYSNVVEGKNYTDSLIQYCKEGKTNSIHEYSWYWHGYLIFLKPALILFDYGEIRQLNMFLQYILLISFIICLHRKGYKKYVFSFIVSIFLLMPATLNLSLQYSACYYVMMIGSMVLVHCYEKFNEKNCFYIFFLILGMSTSFFDFLTYPLVTLGIPLTLFLVLNQKNEFKSLFKSMCTLCVMWAIGYAGMWCGKWFVSSILLQENGFTMGISKIMQRSSNAVGGMQEVKEITIWQVLERNFFWIKNKSYIVLVLGLLFYQLFYFIKNGINQSKLRLMILFGGIAFMPIAWYVVVGNHSYIHYWMTYRECIIFIFAGFSALVKIEKDIQK